MDKTRILPGEQLVAKGALKINSSLPEVGLKDVSPNGTWLEQKQIQAALEARKHLIEVERIEKSGVLSHAEWHEDLMLAEVTRKVGGYWQFLGHNVGKQLFLNPEEALFLMEVNCLLLKYNEVKVSLQQAYALLLRGKISLMQYKVYASLSRLGYKVFRHQRRPDSNISEACSSKEKPVIEKSKNNDSKGNQLIATESISMQETDQSNDDESKIVEDITPQSPKVRPDIQTHKESNNLSYLRTLSDTNETSMSENASTLGDQKKSDVKLNKFKSSKYIQYKMNKLKCRKYRTKQCSMSNDYFANIPEFTKDSIVSVAAPERRFLPGKVYLKNSTYCLNVDRIRTKSTASDEVPATSRFFSDSMNNVNQTNANVNHIGHPPPPHVFRGNNWMEYFNFRFAQPHLFRPFQFWRPQTNLNYFQFNMTFQRPFLYPQFNQRAFLNPFLQPYIMPSEDTNSNSSNPCRRKRTREYLKQEHYASIQNLAELVKKSILELRLSNHNVAKLNHMIQTYNTRYKTRLRLSENFTVMPDENIIDTIEVDDDDEQTSKKPKKDENPDAFNNNLEKLKQLAFQLKNLENKNEATSRHRRMFSNLMKGFNKSYNVDYYVNDNYDVINRNDLTVLSSSDTEEDKETIIAPPKRKKLKNPFYILKKLSDKQSKDDSLTCETSTDNCPFKYSDTTLSTFKKEWLPVKSDFGRAEVVSSDFASDVIDIRREEFLFDFMKIQPDKYNNWLDIKISFLKCLQETCELFHFDERQNKPGLESLVKPKEFNDAALVLNKLSIFKAHKVVNDTSLDIDFDVYNRNNLQSFKKTNRPLPHFRVVCLRESSRMPSGTDVASLHSMYKDNVSIVFAVVGVESISYLQVNPVDLSVYISSNNNTV